MWSHSFILYLLILCLCFPSSLCCWLYLSLNLNVCPSYITYQQFKASLTFNNFSFSVKLWKTMQISLGLHSCCTQSLKLKCHLPNIPQRSGTTVAPGCSSSLRSLSVCLSSTSTVLCHLGSLLTLREVCIWGIPGPLKKRVVLPGYIKITLVLYVPHGHIIHCCSLTSGRNRATHASWLPNIH